MMQVLHAVTAVSPAQLLRRYPGCVKPAIAIAILVVSLIVRFGPWGDVTASRAQPLPDELASARSASGPVPGKRVYLPVVVNGVIPNDPAGVILPSPTTNPGFGAGLSPTAIPTIPTVAAVSTPSPTSTPLASSTPVPTSTPTSTATAPLAATQTSTRTSTATATVTPTSLPTSTPTPNIDPNCVVTSVQSLSTLPLNPWPQNFPSPTWVAQNGYATPPPLVTPVPSFVAVPQVFVGPSRQELGCLSCYALPGTGALSPNLYKTNVDLSPKGDWVIFTGEMAVHPTWGSIPASDASYEQYNGWWGDLWVTTSTGTQWYNLTNLVAPNPPISPVGTLAPKLSPDETKMVWASLVGMTSSTAPLGNWRLMEADFVVTNGVPSLQNVQDISAPNGTWFEPVAWSPDGSTIIVSSDAGLPYQYGADDFAVNLSSGTWTDISNQPLYWDEHAYYSPSGKKVLRESQYPNPALLPQDASLTYDQWRPLLRTEVWVSNPDGSEAMQLTGLNVPPPPGTADPELNSQPSTGSSDLWNADGTQVEIPQAFLDGNTGQVSGTADWLITFAGPCG